MSELPCPDLLPVSGRWRQARYMQLTLQERDLEDIQADLEAREEDVQAREESVHQHYDACAASERVIANTTQDLEELQDQLVLRSERMDKWEEDLSICPPCFFLCARAAVTHV